LYPARRHVAEPPPAGCSDAVFAGEGVTLKGWRCQANGPRRGGTVVFLHGVADNRTSIRGAIARFTGRGLDVVAYDSRAQGESTGTICTYGYWEKRDLKDVLDAVGPGPIVLVGTSLGAAVALQEAPDDPRVVGVVAAESFSDLRTVARERAPHFLTEGMIRRAFSMAETRGVFRVDEVSPVAAARRIRIPVLLIHGALDADTPPDHSRRILAALGGPKELILIAGAHHNESLRADGTWQRIENWVEDVLASPGPR
jgi:pimeloyl-ACP methyl ester carboxylesterase